MEFLTEAAWIEYVGWAASLLTVATYSMRSMIPLRILAIGSASLFLVYGLVLGLWPLVAMDLVLLPINIWRFWQILSLRRQVSQALDGEDADFSIIEKYGRKRSFDAGEVVFRRGDTVDSLYLLSRGSVVIEELGIEIAANDIFGEIAFFNDTAQRTATVRCTADTTVFELDRKSFMSLQFEDPAFGLSVMRTVTRRLTENAARAGHAGQASGAGG